MTVNRKILSAAVLLALVGTACSHGGFLARRPRPLPQGLDSSAKSYLEKKGRGTLPVYDVPIVMNEDVRRWIRFFQSDYQGRFALYLTRSGKYEPFMRRILAEEGLPQDLVYVALIESGFSNFAYSRARAVGPWQFIRSTGHIYGLKTNSWVDERRDPEKATRAAAHYLKKLYGDFGDWYLAMASYNGGEGRIRKAIHRARTDDFWAIASTSHIRPETKNYVPKFIAAALIAKNPSRFGFRHIYYEEPLAFDTVKVRGPIDLEVAAELAGSDFDEMKQLNPELVLGMTPHGPYTLKIPQGREEMFQVAYVQLPADQRVRYVYHTVRHGESLWKIGRRYGVSHQSLIAANDLSPRRARFLRPGSRLLIPKKGAASHSVASHGVVKPVTRTLLAYNQSKSKTNKKPDGVEYLIRKDFGENGAETKSKQAAKEEPTQSEATAQPIIDLKGMERSELPEIEESDLGGEPRTSNLELKTKNQVPSTKYQKPSVVVIKTANAAPPKPESYVVKRGDNLWKIAKRHGVTPSKLKQWNNLKNPNNLRPGKSLVVSGQ